MAAKQMDDDPFLAPPKRTTARRNLAEDPTFAQAFRSSQNTEIPLRDRVLEEPWNLPGFEKPDAFAAQKAKNIELETLKRDFAQVSSPNQQVKDLHSKAALSVEQEIMHTSEIKPKLPTFIQRRLQK